MVARAKPGAPFCAAHRGLSAEQPENTLAAFRAAADAGFPAIELDLRLTADKEVVVLHDAAIERTTDGNGRVADMKYDDLRTHATAAGPVPRLDDVLSALDWWNGLWNLELKASAAALPAIRLVHHHRLGRRAAFSSFDPEALERARKADPSVDRILICAGTPDKEDIAMAKALGASWLNVDHEALDAKVVAAIRKAGLRVGTYTVNDSTRALELVSWGVECIITDRREVLLEIPGQPGSEPSF